MRLRLWQLRLERPRQWGGCWRSSCGASSGSNTFWAAWLPPSRKDTCWDEMLLILVVYRAIELSSLPCPSASQGLAGVSV